MSTSNFGILTHGVILATGLGTSIILVGYWAWQKLKTPHVNLKWEEVGKVSELLIYPVKSARGIRKSQARATTYGLACGALEDRSLMVIGEDGYFVTSRHAGRLATIVTQVEGHILTLMATGHDDLIIDLREDIKGQPTVYVSLRGIQVCGVECGNTAAEWLTDVLYKGERRVKLIYRGDVNYNRQGLSPSYFKFKNFRKNDRLYYADEGSFMVLTQSSLDDLNSRLADPVTLDNFRPNIVVSGAEAFDEDDWAYIKIRDVVLRRLKPCERCSLTTVDPVSGTRHPNSEPITTLNKYRIMKDPPASLLKRWAKSPIFGVTMSIDVTGSVSVGDAVFAARVSVHPELGEL